MRNTRHYWGMPCMAAAIMILAAVSFSSAAERQPGISIGFNAGTGWMLDGELGAGFSGRAFVEYAPYIHEIGLKLSGGARFITNPIQVAPEPFVGEAEGQEREKSQQGDKRRGSGALCA